MFEWMAQEETLSAAALTVRAQTISPNDDGTLLYDAFMPRQDVDSVRLHDITTVDFRPVADRREWGQRGRAIPLATPDLRDIEMIPIESFFTIGEREIQTLEERTLGNQALFREIVGPMIPERTDKLVEANYRRVEVDVFSAWATRTVTAVDPQSGRKVSVEFPFSDERYLTADEPWSDASVNAYDQLLAFLEYAIDMVGPYEGVMIRLGLLKTILADAPHPLGLDNVRVSRRDLESMIEDHFGLPFRFYVNESTVDVFEGGGKKTVRTKVWPENVLAVVPQGERVGYTAFAPVARAFALAREAPDAGIDVRGMTVFTETANGGRQLTVEAQGNIFPVPDESRMCVIDAGG